MQYLIIFAVCAAAAQAAFYHPIPDVRADGHIADTPAVAAAKAEHLNAHARALAPLANAPALTPVYYRAYNPAYTTAYAPAYTPALARAYTPVTAPVHAPLIARVASPVSYAPAYSPYYATHAVVSPARYLV